MSSLRPKCPFQKAKIKLMMRHLKIDFGANVKFVELVCEAYNFIKESFLHSSVKTYYLSCKVLVLFMLVLWFWALCCHGNKVEQMHRTLHRKVTDYSHKHVKVHIVYIVAML